MRVCDIREKFFIIRPIMIFYCCLAYISFTECFSLSLSLSAFKKRLFYSENRNYHLRSFLFLFCFFIDLCNVLLIPFFCHNIKR